MPIAARPTSVMPAPTSGTPKKPVQHRGANPQERWVLSLTRCPFSLLDLPMRFTNDCRIGVGGELKVHA